jgi:hypothetical protein
MDGFDPTAATPPAGTPSTRALSAMELAARRARETTGSVAPAGTGPAAGPAAGPAPSSRPPRWTRERQLWIAVVVAAVLVVGAGVSLAVVSTTDNQTASAPTTTTSSTTSTTVASHGGGTATVAPAGRPHPARHKVRRRRHPHKRTTIPAGTAPFLSSLNPKAASAGQSVVITGARFMSSNGTIVAAFNGTEAPTDCPQSTSCTVTVPSLSTSGTVHVTVTTSAGTSNVLSFTYR